ncbi:hypothetical protein FT641_19215 [Bacillus paranthracis]|uniref:hypothetical protein n=1 Tax=Bacillus paranthracis TaxID=2026186 RepID=UPI00187AA20D|nr:hypothetical protein [Bacillus paranthracis]MBE7114303.1 hypothetical protein [Bacillus paranthracis]MBE7154824.1 hypothetical protein [Bacillus paranthracis]
MFKKVIGVILVAIVLTGCGGGSDAQNTKTSKQASEAIGKQNNKGKELQRLGDFEVLKDYGATQDLRHDTDTIEEMKLLRDVDTQCKYVYIYARKMDGGGVSLEPKYKKGQVDCGQFD